MEAIIDTVESLCYGNPCKGDEHVDETHRVIRISKGTALKGVFKRLRSFILLELHDEKDLQPLNGRVIRQHWTKGDLLLPEGHLKQVEKNQSGFNLHT